MASSVEEVRTLQVAKKEVDSVKRGRRVYETRGARVLFLSQKREVSQRLQKEIDEKVGEAGKQ